MPFRNEIAGGNGSLVRNWLQSPNFVAGASGWIIRKDGSVEFNNGTFRGSIEVGPLAGAHFIVNNTSTGDVIDVYNGAGVLVFSIDGNGNLTSGNTAGGPFIFIDVNGFINWHEHGFVPTNSPSISSNGINVGSTELTVTSGQPTVGGVQSFLELFGGQNAAGAEIRVSQRNVIGDDLQLDTTNNSNNLVHVGIYTVNTNANGDITFNHGCQFTPLEGVLVGQQNAANNPFYSYAWYNNPFTNVTAHAQLLDHTSNPYANIVGATIYGIFFG